MLDPKKVKPTKLLWVDLEMTGPDPSSHAIVEIAAVVTDFTFAPLASYRAVIHQPESVLQDMHPWAKQQHAISGLTDRIRSHGQPEAEVIDHMTKLITEHFGDEPAILAGNSVYNDLLFIKRYWPEVYKLLHYRTFDVTAFKILMQGKYHQEYQKKESHRAEDDIQESIAELKHYLEWFAKNSHSI